MRAFGPFQLDSRTGELTRKGLRVRLQPQQARLLTLLTSQPGRLYSREEIYDELWANQSYGNFEQSLNFAVSQLRAALSDSAESSLYIETVPKLGYRFVGAIQENPGNGSIASGLPDAKIPASPQNTNHDNGTGIPNQPLASLPVAGVAGAHRLSSSRLRWMIAGLATTILAIAVTAWWYLPMQPPRANAFAQITTADAIDYLVKPVMDGARIFYIERSGGHWITRQASLEGGDPQTVPGLPENTRIMDLSPNRATYLLGRFTSRSSTSTLWLMPVQGGPPVRLGDISSGEAVWHPDGNHIVFARGNELWSVGTDASNPMRLVSLPGAPNWLAWSPDGQRMRLTIGDDNGGTSLWEMRQDGSNLHRMFLNASPDDHQCCGEWTPDGRYFIFTSNHQGSGNLWALREPGFSLRRAPPGPFQIVAGWPGNVMGSCISTDGKSVLFYAGRNRSQIQRFDTKTNRLTALSPEGFSEPEYSADGRWLVYVDVNNDAVWKVNTESSEKVQLNLAGFLPTFPRWSPDGKVLAVTASDRGAAATAYLIPAMGGAPQPLLPGPLQVSDPDWASDGKTLAVVHAVPGQLNESALFLVDLATRTEKMVPGSNGHFFPHWSPDGHYLAAYADNEKVVDVFSFATNTWQTIARGTAIGFPVWSHDGRYIYYQRILDEGEPVYRFNVRTGLTDHVASFDAELSGGIWRCALMGLAPDDALLIDTTRGYSDLYRAELTLPR
jgi:Tol biopolymer transport system component/DNA-binding winged helix-turn-helix (wHTH) protein